MQTLLTITFAILASIAFAGIMIYAVRSECLSEPCANCRRPLPEGQRGFCDACAGAFSRDDARLSDADADRAAAAVILDRPKFIAPRS